MKFSLFIFVLLLLSISFKKLIEQDFTQKQVPSTLQNNYNKNLLNYVIPKSTLQNAYDLNKLVSKNSNKDFTGVIQTAINENRIVIFPDFPLKINKRGLKLKSNSTIIFRENSKLIIAANDSIRYALFHVEKVENVVIYHPNLIGDKLIHTGTKGEWGMGIFLSGSKNILIYRPRIENTWGDGIYIGRTKNLSCENIKVYDANINNARRNGISIVSGMNILINNAIISNTNGTNPMAGIDVEPNNNNDILNNIQINNINTFNNKNSGIILALKGLVGNNIRKINIGIKNHNDVESKYALNMSTGDKKTVLDGHPVNGVVTIENSNYYDNNLGIQIFNARYNDLKVNILNPRIIKKGVLDNKSMERYKTQINKYYNKLK